VDHSFYFVWCSVSFWPSNREVHCWRQRHFCKHMSEMSAKCDRKTCELSSVVHFPLIAALVFHFLIVVLSFFHIASIILFFYHMITSFAHAGNTKTFKKFILIKKNLEHCVTFSEFLFYLLLIACFLGLDRSNQEPVRFN